MTRNSAIAEKPRDTTPTIVVDRHTD